MFLNEIPQKIDAKMLSQFIPHSGPMVLLDWVEEWDERHILCTTHSHLSKENPLRIDNVLSVVHSIEYAAQAASLHAALLSMKYQKPLPGIDKFGAISTAYLALVKEFHFIDIEIGGFQDPFMVHAYDPDVGPRLLQYHVRTAIGDKTLAYGLITLVVEG